MGGSLNWAQTAFSYSIGDITESLLTEVQYQAQFGSEWVLCDGQSIAGSDLDTLITLSNAPDCRGKFVRGLDNGRGIDSGRVINTDQAEQNKDHTHKMFANVAAITNSTGSIALPYIGKTYYSSGGSPTNVQLASSFTEPFGVTESNGGDPRPHNIAVNFFIKVNN